MRVDEVFKQAASLGTVPVSFEMFPPKGELTLDTARKVAGSLCKLSPSFVSVTCSAGGSGNGATTAPIAHMITSEFDTPSVAHLTCVGRTHADIAAKIDEYRTAGVNNILALRGDLPAGATEDDKPASEYAYARRQVHHRRRRLPRGPHCLRGPQPLGRIPQAKAGLRRKLLCDATFL